MNSCIYEGRVRHRRRRPVENSFEYSLFLMYLDLAELPDVFRGRWLWSCDRIAPARFRRSDYLGDPDVPLDEAVRRTVREAVGSTPRGPIRLLTHLRYFGYIFNPVSVYYCFDEAGERVETVVAEITNTPWKERFRYVLGMRENRSRGRARWFRFAKKFHVSPFMEMDLEYEWRFSEPGRRLWVHMDVLREGNRFFDATLRLERREIDGPALARALLRHPFMTGRVTAAIHYQALRLWLKRCPFHTHPAKRGEEAKSPEAR
jgi:DUF1365 family protein